MRHLIQFTVDYVIAFLVAMSKCQARTILGRVACLGLPV